MPHGWVRSRCICWLAARRCVETLHVSMIGEPLVEMRRVFSTDHFLKRFQRSRVSRVYRPYYYRDLLLRMGWRSPTLMGGTSLKEHRFCSGMVARALQPLWCLAWVGALSLHQDGQGFLMDKDCFSRPKAMYCPRLDGGGMIWHSCASCM